MFHINPSKFELFTCKYNFINQQTTNILNYFTYDNFKISSNFHFIQITKLIDLFINIWHNISLRNKIIFNIEIDIIYINKFIDIVFIKNGLHYVFNINGGFPFNFKYFLF